MNWRKLLRVAPAILLACILFLVVTTRKTLTDATVILNELRDLGASRNPTAGFKALQQKYGSKLHPIEGCTAQNCGYEIDFSNGALSVLHVVPYVEMNVWFHMYRGSLVLAMLEYRTALNGPNSPVVHVQQGMCGHGCGVRFDVNPHGTSQNMWNGMVEFDTRASAEQRDAALALNLDCFTRIGGCKDIIDLLPTMWEHSGPGKISSRLLGLSQKLEESHGFPSADDF
jgi:hypothetical protein